LAEGGGGGGGGGASFCLNPQGHQKRGTRPPGAGGFRRGPAGGPGRDRGGLARGKGAGFGGGKTPAGEGRGTPQAGTGEGPPKGGGGGGGPNLTRGTRPAGGHPRGRRLGSKGARGGVGTHGPGTKLGSPGGAPRSKTKPRAVRWTRPRRPDFLGPFCSRGGRNFSVEAVRVKKKKPRHRCRGRGGPKKKRWREISGQRGQGGGGTLGFRLFFFGAPPRAPNPHPRGSGEFHGQFFQGFWGGGGGFFGILHRAGLSLTGRARGKQKPRPKPGWPLDLGNGCAVGPGGFPDKKKGRRHPGHDVFAPKFPGAGNFLGVRQGAESIYQRGERFLNLPGGVGGK